MNMRGLILGIGLLLSGGLMGMDLVVPTESDTCRDNKNSKGTLKEAHESQQLPDVKECSLSDVSGQCHPGDTDFQ